MTSVPVHPREPDLTPVSPERLPLPDPDPDPETAPAVPPEVEPDRELEPA
ncbi:MAG TPA: hypothetical protein VFK42_18140 [Acidimicrobiales bacterium]|jgi:hypothetical protein|nr:hypothetical protein [Acidimicrobiales bacterium]